MKKMTLRLFLIIFTIIVLPIGLIAQDKMFLSVLDLEGRGISALEAGSLTDRLRSELSTTNAVTIVERGQMQEVLDEQGFQQTGCVSSECAVEVGKLLGVSHMVTGSIGKLGTTFTLDVRIFSVQDGGIVNTVSKSYQGPIDGLLTQIEMTAWELIGLTPPAGKFPDAAPAQVAASEPAKPEKVKKKGSGRRALMLLVLAAAGGGGYYAYSEGMFDSGSDVLPEPPALP